MFCMCWDADIRLEEELADLVSCGDGSEDGGCDCGLFDGFTPPNCNLFDCDELLILFEVVVAVVVFVFVLEFVAPLFFLK